MSKVKEYNIFGKANTAEYASIEAEVDMARKELVEARALAGLSQEEVAEEVGVTRTTVSQWERGLTKPYPVHVRRLCKLFGKTAEELGLGTKFQESVQRESQVTPNVDAVKTLLDFLANTALQEHSMSDKGHQDMDTMRRQVLVQLLDAAGITLLSPALATVTSSSSLIAVEEFVLQCASSLKACWQLMKGKGLPIVEEILSTYVPSLTVLIQQSSRHIETLTGLAAQAKILQALLAMHRLDFLSREMYCYEAITYGQFSGEKWLHASALMYLAYTYTYCPPRQPEKAVKLFLEGLRILGDEPSVLRSHIYSGLGDAYAQCKTEREALETIELAHMHFPDHPELDPGFFYADYGGQSEIYLWQGKMYLDLAVHYPDRDYAQKAFNAFSHSMKLQPASERTTTETIIYQADAARGIGDLDRYVTLLTQGVQMAHTLGSQKRYSEAFDIFQRTPVQWKNEQSIRQLAEEAFRELPQKVMMCVNT